MSGIDAPVNDSSLQLNAEDQAQKEEDDKHMYNTKAIAVSTNKALTSKFRGVCWNKKNKRWQAAINSNGRYLYLGSYDTQEEAARVFDKAAVRVRGPKARINYALVDYVDVQGLVLPDALVESLLLTACNPTKQRRQRNKQGEITPGDSDASAPGTDKASAEIALQALARFVGPSLGQPKNETGLPLGFGSLLNSNQLLSSALPHQGGLSHFLQLQNPGNVNNQDSMLVIQQNGFQQQGGLNQQHLVTAQRERSSSGQVGDVSSSTNIFSAIQLALPPGTALDSIIPSESPDVVGALYRDGNNSGAGIWNGKYLHNLGLYGSDKDAKQACMGSLTLFAKLNGQDLGSGPSISLAAPQVEQRPQSVPINSSLGLPNLCQQQKDSGTGILHPSNWGLAQGGQIKSFQLHQSQQPQSLGHVDGGGGVQRPYLLNIDNVGLFPQLAVCNHLGGGLSFSVPGQANSRAGEMMVNPDPVRNLKLETVTLVNANQPGIMPNSSTWQIHVSQPDPINTSGLSTGTQEIIGESIGGRLASGYSDIPTEEDPQRAGVWAVQGRANGGEFATLRQLANIDVNEALQLFIASKQGFNNRQQPVSK